MIIFNISGGLGNQFFQYAFGRYLAHKNNTKLHLNISSYLNEKDRDFKLHYFNTTYSILKVDEIRKFIHPYRKLNTTLKRLYNSFLPVRFKIYFENLTASKPILNLRKARKGYFDGYWGNENYFSGIYDILKEELSLKNEYKTPELKKSLNIISQTNAVAIHIRRGDYVSHPVYSKIFSAVPLDYYISAMEYLKRKFKDPVFYIFSNDYIWVQKNFKDLNYNIVLVNSFKLAEDYLEFELMKSCNHQIIANSTFSWWAAWLNDYPKKIVIAPENWYCSEVRNKELDLPINWIKL